MFYMLFLDRVGGKKYCILIISEERDGREFNAKLTHQAFNPEELATYIREGHVPSFNEGQCNCYKYYDLYSFYRPNANRTDCRSRRGPIPEPAEQKADQIPNPLDRD